MAGLVLKSKRTMDMIEQERNKGSRADYFKPKPNAKGVFKVFICPPKNEDVAIVQKAVVHEIFNKKQRLGGVVSPSNWEEKDPFQKIGWSLFNKYKESKNKKLKEFYKYMIGKDKNIIYVIDPTDIEAGIQVWQAPKAVIDFVLNDIDQNEGSMDFCHPQTGKFLVVKKTGVELQTKYQCGWSKTDTELDGIDEDKLVEMLEEIPDSIIGTMFKKPTKDEIEDFKEVVDNLAEKVGISINWKNAKDSGGDKDADDDDADDDKDGESDDLGEDDAENFADDDDLDLADDDADEKPAKGADKKAADKKAEDKKAADKKAADAKKLADKKAADKKAADKAAADKKKKPVEDEDDLELDEDDAASDSSDDDDLDLDE